MIGTVLGGRYTILEEVGKGGMAYVYKAQCNVLNRIVAVKVLRNDLEGGEEFVNRFKAEAQSAACLTHPNIVSIYDVGEENGIYYIVMEYIEGTTLKEYIKQKGRLSSLESANIASQICGALSVAHEKNIIHRDIKPHNILITSTNLVKVTDFGIARASNSSTMRVADSILGSVHYISPEQARGGYVDCRSDIYSLGIVLYEMLTGKVPFESESPIAVAMKHLEEIPVNPTTLTPDVAVELEDIVLRAISKETRKRFQTVDGFKAALDAFLNTLKASPDAQETEETPAVIPAGEILDFENEDDNYIADAEDIPMSSDVSDEEEPEESDEEYEESEEYEEEYTKPRSALNMIIAALLIALLVVGGGFMGALYFINPDAPIFMFFKNSDVDVPDFTNIQFEKAQELADKYGLVLEIGDKKPGPDEEGTVVYQSISKGNSVKKGTHITVHLSMGPENIDSSSYRGVSADIIDDFREKGYSVEVKYKSSTEVAEDLIIGVTRKGDRFIFTVSTGGGEIDCVVPDLLRCTKAEARERLEENGLLLNEKVTYIESTTVDPGRVVEQSIAPGEKVSPKTKISVILAEEKSGEDEESEGSEETKVKEKVFNYSTEILSGPTVVKIVEKASDGTTKVVFEQTVDPATLDEIVVKVKGSGVNEYSIYHGGEFITKSKIDFTK